MKTVHQQISFLILLAFFLVLGSFLHSALLIFKPRRIPKEPQPKTPRLLKPKSEDDCRLCKIEKESPHNTLVLASPPPPWCEVRSRRGRKKSIHTQGYACNNPECIYYHVMDESIHALVGYGFHGKQELSTTIRFTHQRQLEIPMANGIQKYASLDSLLPLEPSRCAEEAAETSTVKGGSSGFPP